LCSAGQRGGRDCAAKCSRTCLGDRESAGEALSSTERESEELERRIDHHFDAEIDQRIREEAAADCADLGMDARALLRAHDRGALPADGSNYGDRQLEDVPARYRKHLASDLDELSVAPHRRRWHVESARLLKPEQLAGAPLMSIHDDGFELELPFTPVSQEEPDSHQAGARRRRLRGQGRRGQSSGRAEIWWLALKRSLRELAAPEAGLRRQRRRCAPS
jgi:hypothetical protein